MVCHVNVLLPTCRRQMPSNEVCLSDVTTCPALQPFCFAVSLAWHTLDINDFDASFVDSSQAIAPARPVPAAICTSGALLSPSDMRIRRQIPPYETRSTPPVSSTTRMWSALVKERQESYDRPDGRLESDERWAGACPLSAYPHPFRHIPSEGRCRWVSLFLASEH